MVSNAEMDRRWKLVRNVMAGEGLDWLVGGVGMPAGMQSGLPTGQRKVPSLS